jgi:Uma2 family endonuclease
MTEEATLADLLANIGDVPPQRVRARPAPGTATEKDLLKLVKRGVGRFELVDGVLVEKAMGHMESFLAAELSGWLWTFLRTHPLGYLVGETSTMRVLPGIVRSPDVGFISWHLLGAEQVPDVPMPDLTPDLAVEVVSEGNSTTEIERKLRDYFLGGTRLAWVVDPRKRTVTIYTAPDESFVQTEDETLDGGDVLPGFSLPLATLFAGVGKKREKPRRKSTSRKRRKK